MKKTFLLLTVSTSLLLFTSCSKPNTTQENQNKPAEAGTPQNPPVVENKKAETQITGVVSEVQPGKDGYTAKITSTSGQIFFATISRSNLKNAAEYRSAAIGDTLKIKGDHWQMENENHITVRELK